MAVPKQKKSKSRRDHRRSQHDKVSARSIAHCPSCMAPKLPHRVCPSCGYYKDRTVIEFVDATDGE